MDGVDINNNSEVMGKILTYIDDETDSEQIIIVSIAPYLTNNEISFQDVLKNEDNPDFDEVKEQLNRISLNRSEQEKIFNKCISIARSLLFKYQNKIKQFTEALLERKSMDADEISFQWQSDELIKNDNSSKSELKFEKNKFNVEKVQLLMFCPEIGELDIFKDVEAIFNQTHFIEDFLDSEINKEPSKKMDESKICWAFNADFSQQKAVYDTLENENMIIQGPPGTGKTQTILNLISNALSKNKKILIVSEKTTAVDVINDRIKSNAPKLNDFVLDLYNINKKGIKFYQELGKKTYNLYSNRTHSSFLPKADNLQGKVDKINEVACQLENINLLSLIKKSKEIKVSEPEKQLIFSLHSNDYEKMSEFTDSKIRNIEQWIIRKNELKQFKDNHFAANISEELIRSLYELNKNEPYTPLNKYKFASLLLRNKPKVSIFFRNKFKKAADDLKLNDLFRKDFSEFKEYFDFEYSKYTDNDLEIFNDVKKIKSSHCNLNRILQITDYWTKRDKYFDIKNNMSSLDINDFSDINNLENFNNTHLYLYSLWCGKIEWDIYRKMAREILQCQSRKNMTKVVKDIIYNTWPFLYKTFPIVLCTPETLSKYVPLKQNMYDLVIIDEASQFLIERSIPALFRGKVKIISGDDQQLRPKIENRFDSSEWESNDKNIKYSELIETESILDLFQRLFGQSGTMLTVHYRSEKDELIKFSNEHFYENKLNFIENASALSKKNSY